MYSEGAARPEKTTTRVVASTSLCVDWCLEFGPIQGPHRTLVRKVTRLGLQARKLALPDRNRLHGLVRDDTCRVEPTVTAGLLSRDAVIRSGTATRARDQLDVPAVEAYPPICDCRGFESPSSS